MLLESRLWGVALLPCTAGNAVIARPFFVLWDLPCIESGAFCWDVRDAKFKAQFPEVWYASSVRDFGGTYGSSDFPASHSRSHSTTSWRARDFSLFALSQTPALLVLIKQEQRFQYAGTCPRMGYLYSAPTMTKWYTPVLADVALY